MHPGWAEHKVIAEKNAAEKEVKRIAEEARLAQVALEKKIAEEKA